jgi:hypothetical protein
MMALNILLGLMAFVLGFRAVDRLKENWLVPRLIVASTTIGPAFYGLWLAFVAKEQGWGIVASSAGLSVGLVLFVLSFSRTPRPSPAPLHGQPSGLQKQQPRGIK